METQIRKIAMNSSGFEIFYFWNICKRDNVNLFNRVDISESKIIQVL